MQGLQQYQPKLFVQIDINSLIPKNHILRKIDMLLDLSFVRELTSKYYCTNNGRPSIDPELFFRIILIGYIFNISSDRKLCEELRYNLAYRWYCRLDIDDFTPDHSSLTRIRDRYEDSVFEIFFTKVVELCKLYGLVKGERIITDGTLIEADASIDSMVPIDREEADLEHKRTDMTSPMPSRKISNKTHVSKTDPDSSLAKKEGKPRALRYKVHISIDADNRIILDNKVTTGSTHETQIYLDRISFIESQHKIPILEAIADRGYGAAENIKALQEKDIKTYIPLFSTKAGKSIELQDQGFKYDREEDKYICPKDKYLRAKIKDTHGVIYISDPKDCFNCPMKDSCPTGTRAAYKGAKCIFRNYNQDLYEKELKRMQQPDFQNALHDRMWKIEGINAEAKNLHGLKRARYRGLKKVQIQAHMVASVLNLKRLVALCFKGFILCIVTSLLYIQISIMIRLQKSNFYQILYKLENLVLPS